MSYANPRLNMSKSLLENMVAFSEGNPGACRALGEVIAIAPTADPDSALGPLGPICTLDNLDCYGSRIWMLFKDVCGQDAHAMLGVLRACQMGFTSEREINAAIDGGRLDVKDLLRQVKERLPAFQIAKAA